MPESNRPLPQQIPWETYCSLCRGRHVLHFEHARTDKQSGVGSYSAPCPSKRSDCHRAVVTKRFRRRPSDGLLEEVTDD